MIDDTSNISQACDGKQGRKVATCGPNVGVVTMISVVTLLVNTQKRV